MDEEHDTNAAILAVMVRMSVVDGNIADEEVGRILFLYERMAGEPLAVEAIQAELARIVAAPRDLESELRRVASGFVEAERRRLLKAAFAIASADGEVLDEEDEMLLAIARGLDIAPEAYRASLTQFAVSREFFAD